VSVSVSVLLSVVSFVSCSVGDAVIGDLVGLEVVLLDTGNDGAFVVVVEEGEEVVVFVAMVIGEDVGAMVVGTAVVDCTEVVGEAVGIRVVGLPVGDAVVVGEADGDTLGEYV